MSSATFSATAKTASVLIIRMRPTSEYMANSEANWDTSSMVRLIESITMFGLLLAFVVDYQWFFLWFLLGIGATILHYPSRKNIDAASYKI